MTGASAGGAGSPDLETARRIAQFDFSIELFEQNYAELEAFLQYLEAPFIVINLAPLNERWRQHIAMREVTYRLHNYVAAAQSLIDHARVLYIELYQPQGLFPDYPDEVVRRFAANPLAQFVRKLRNMAQHYRLPNIRLNTSVVPGPLSTGVRGQWLLTVADLSQWSGWNPPAKEYLTAAGETLDIHRVVTDYHGQIMEFYKWFKSRQSQIHGLSPAAYVTERSRIVP
jgi:hypothetical protein